MPSTSNQRRGKKKEEEEQREGGGREEGEAQRIFALRELQPRVKRCKESLAAARFGLGWTTSLRRAQT